MASETSSLDALAERFAHPSVRVMARELAQMARDLERGTLAWPRTPPVTAWFSAALPGLESIEAALNQRRDRSLAVDQSDWACFARTVQAGAGAADDAVQQPPLRAPHPVSVIALRLVWGSERFRELPTVILKPPPAPFLEQLARLPAPERAAAPEQLVQAVSAWLQERQPLADQEHALLTVGDVRGFVRVVASCRVVGQLRKEVTLEDVAAGYLAWARLLRANLDQLSDISSGWWSSTGRQPGIRPDR
ncbi:MAG TPA: hypothetical protein VH599_05480 [Ktedonobacterales bacterium]|jgi:hypothetical protein